MALPSRSQGAYSHFSACEVDVQKAQFHGFILASTLMAWGCSESSSSSGSAGSAGTPGASGALGSAGTGTGTGGAPPAASGGQSGQTSQNGGSSGALAGGSGASTGGTTSTAGAASGGASGAGGPNDTGPATVQLAQVRQLIRGFGINNNWRQSARTQSACSEKVLTRSI